MKIQTSPDAQRSKSPAKFHAYALKATALAERSLGRFISDADGYALRDLAAQYLVNTATIYSNRKGGPSVASEAAYDLANDLLGEVSSRDMPDLLEEVTGTCLHLLDCFYTKES